MSRNRWIGWAHDLRRRHDRRDLRRSPGRMVFLRPAGSFTQLLLSVHRTLVQVHARFSLPRALPPVGPATILARSPITRVDRIDAAGRDVSPVAGLPQWRGRVAPTSPAGPGRFTIATRRHLEEPSAVLAEPAPAAAAIAGTGRRDGARSIGTRSRELVTVLRRRGARRELPVTGTPRVLAAAGQNLARASMVQSGMVATAMRVAPETSAVAAPAPAAPSVDVQALTSQVIQQLDRRLIAYRERMGRV